MLDANRFGEENENRNALSIPDVYCFTDHRSQSQTIPRIIVNIVSLPLGNSYCSIYMWLYQGAPDRRQTSYYESLIMKCFWKHMSQGWSWRIKGWITRTREERSSGRKIVLIQVHDLYGPVYFANNYPSISQAGFVPTAVGAFLVQSSWEIIMKCIQSVELHGVQGGKGDLRHLTQRRWQERDWVQLLSRFGDILLIKDVSATEGCEREKHIHHARCTFHLLRGYFEG